MICLIHWAVPTLRLKPQPLRPSSTLPKFSPLCPIRRASYQEPAVHRGGTQGCPLHHQAQSSSQSRSVSLLFRWIQARRVLRANRGDQMEVPC